MNNMHALPASWPQSAQTAFCMLDVHFSDSDKKEKLRTIQ